MDTERKLTIQDLIDDSVDKDKSADQQQQKHTYKFINNQKEYSHTQKIKP